MQPLSLIRDRFVIQVEAHSGLDENTLAHALRTGLIRNDLGTHVTSIKVSKDSIPESSDNLFDVEKDAIIRALIRCKGNRTHAAIRVGISVRTLQRKLKLYGIETEAQFHRILALG